MTVDYISSDVKQQTLSTHSPGNQGLGWRYRQGCVPSLALGEDTPTLARSEWHQAILALWPHCSYIYLWHPSLCVPDLPIPLSDKDSCWGPPCPRRMPPILLVDISFLNITMHWSLGNASLGGTVQCCSHNFLVSIVFSCVSQTLDADRSDEHRSDPGFSDILYSWNTE